MIMQFQKLLNLSCKIYTWSCLHAYFSKNDHFCWGTVDLERIFKLSCLGDIPDVCHKCPCLFQHPHIYIGTQKRPSENNNFHSSHISNKYKYDSNFPSHFRILTLSLSLYKALQPTGLQLANSYHHHHHQKKKPYYTTFTFKNTRYRHAQYH